MQGGRPVAFDSRSLNPAEANYHPGELELLAVVQALKTWRCYLEGVKSIVVTDHNPLVHLQSQPSLSRKQARWSEFLQSFDFEWRYRPGPTNPADPLSRLPGRLVGAVLLLASVKKSATRRAPTRATAPSVQQPLRQALSYQHIVEQCRLGYKSDHWYTIAFNTAPLTLQDGLFFQGKSLAVPLVGTLRKDILKEVHDTPYSGHLGVNRTYELVARLFWWPSLRADVDAFVKTCHSCQRNKAVHQAPGGFLQPLEIPARSWESVGVDFITRLPETRAGFSQIMVMICRLSKMVHLAPLPANASAVDVARVFHHEVFRLHGLPSELVSDRDSKFTGHFWKEVHRLLGTQLCMSTAFHPQSDGQTERVNPVLEDMLPSLGGLEPN